MILCVYLLQRTKRILPTPSSAFREWTRNTPQVLCDFNISGAVYETAESFADFAKEKGHEIVTDIENDIVFKGNEYSVRRLISILTDNAVKYASVGSPIEISLKRGKR